MPSTSRSPSRSPVARTRRPPASLNSSFFDFEHDHDHGHTGAGPSRAGAGDPRTPTTATFSAQGSGLDGSWFSTPMTRPGMRRHVSATIPPSSPNPGLGQSFPGSMYVSSRGKVLPQNDYLANWETLADLMIPSDHEGPINARKRDGSSPAAALRSSATASRSTLMQSPTLSLPGLPEADDSDVSVSGVLSSSPTNIDNVMDSLASVVADHEESPQPSPRPTPSSPNAIRYRRSAPHLRVASGPPNLRPPLSTKRRVSWHCCADALEGPPQWKKRWQHPPWLTDVLKCGLAYLIASLFTFVPALSNLLSMRKETDVHGRIHPRPAYSAHMVATVVVYVS